MRRLTYTLETTPEDSHDARILEKIGLEQLFDRSPYFFTTDSKSEMFNMIDVMDEEGYESDWTITKKGDH